MNTPTTAQRRVVANVVDDTVPASAWTPSEITPTDSGATLIVYDRTR